MSLLRSRSLRLCGLSLIMLLVVLSSSHYAMWHRRNVEWTFPPRMNNIPGLTAHNRRSDLASSRR
jgi:hypothetical protein